MLGELVKAFILIFVAEMGDKTQIIAMTFATQYLVREVLLGVGIGVFFNHGLAILLGRYLNRLFPLDKIQLAAGLLFLAFGFLALRDEDDEEEGERKKFGPILTVALAFFVGELGDKTQLTAMTLSAEGNYPLFILIGTTLGMIATSSLGIFVGKKIGDKIPDFYVKIVSSMVFVFFGSLKIISQLPKAYVNSISILVYILVVVGLEACLIIRLKRSRTGKSQIQKAAERLYQQTELISKALEDICLGEESCGNCQGTGCIIGYTKYILKNARDNENYFVKRQAMDFSKLDKKSFDRNKLIDALVLIVRDYSEYGHVEDDSFIVNDVRHYLEYLLFKEEVDYRNLDDYIEKLGSLDQELASIIKAKVYD